MTGFSGQPRPRGFRHRFIYYDEHRRVVDEAERRARERAGQQTANNLPGDGATAENGSAAFRSAFKSSLQRRRAASSRAWSQTGNIGCLLALILLITALFVLLD